MKIRVTAHTDRVGSSSSTEFEMDEEEWNSYSDQEKEEICLDSLWNLIDWNWEVI